MSDLRNNVILVDVDGVLVDWEYHFEKWIEDTTDLVAVDPDHYKINVKYDIPRGEGKRLARLFNESAEVRYLSPLRDVKKYIKKLNEEHGYTFHAITSLSNNRSAQKLRILNLKDLFGDVFVDYTILDTGADKDEALEPFKNTEAFWIEDKPENADLGLSLGLDSVLVSHKHNKDYPGLAKVANDWKEIYEYITGE
jgi:FMN phosphatase YigB (HAD superfamily)